MYFHKVSGVIPENKHKEFEQTFKFAGTELPKGCTAIEFSRDLDDIDRYYFISFWDKLDSMEHFKHSSASVILLGAFRTLGELSENKTGIMIEIN